MRPSKKRSMLATLALLIACNSILYAQDAEKQNVINALQDEVNAYIKKDRAKWSASWVHGPKTKSVSVMSGSYFERVGWDAIDKNYASYWTSTETYKGSKSDFDVNVQGSMAVVHLVQTWDSKSDQTIILQKENKVWKIIEMYTFYKESYGSSDGAVEANLNAQGYKLIEAKKIDEAIKVFQLNTELYPASWNVWDSLGEAYLLKGDKMKAKEYYQKSVDINPKNETGLQALAELK